MRPDDEFLSKSIAAAFDRLPEPEAARLEGLERRLSLRAAPRAAKRVRARFWWLLAGLVATGAAAWWGGDYWRDASMTPQTAASPTTPRDASNEERRPRPKTADESESRHEEVSNSQNGSTTIYRREAY
jgi:hypothetical protein